MHADDPGLRCVWREQGGPGVAIEDGCEFEHQEKNIEQIKPELELGR